MLRNYLLTALRHTRNNRLYAILNLVGLAIGYAACTLIGIYLIYETSFETFHSKADRIYRPTNQWVSGGGYEVHWARVNFNYINELPNEMPEVERLIRFQNHGRTYLRIGQEKFLPKHPYTTDADVFEVFDFDLLAGNPQTALKEPYSIVITESMAKTYFGETDPMGQELFVVGQYNTEEHRHTVTGVMRDLPSHTHLPVDVLMSFRRPEDRSWWAYTYILLTEGADISSVEEKINEFIYSHSGETAEEQHTFIHFQALPDIHLHSHLARELVLNGNELYVKIFAYVALFILLIAMINYLNLSSALSIGRAKEVGMRLILGSAKHQLIRAALIESILYHLIAAGLALLIVFALLPSLKSAAGIELLMHPIALIGSLLLLATLCGLLSGIYPASILTASSSLQMLRHNRSFSLSQSSSGYWLKRFLVGLQFCASILLISSAWMARNQVEFLQEKNLGLSTEQILTIPGIPNPVTDKYPIFRDRVQSIPGVQAVSACMDVPSKEIRDVGPTLVQGRNQDSQQAPMLDMQVIGPGFTDLMEIELLAGEDRTDRYVYGPVPQFGDSLSPADYLGAKSRSYLINETASRELGFETPEEAVGQQVSWAIGGFQLAVGPITGVIKDYHQETLKNKVDPTIMVMEQIWLRTILLKVETKNIQSTITEIETLWNDLFPTYPMNYAFLDELYHELYVQERKQLQLLITFSGLAIFIAFLGLFSLIAYALRTRTKEIAVRRVLGAERPHLIKLISKEYLWVLFIGGLVAIPLSYVGLKEWLENFAYQVGISPWVYVLTLLLVLTLVLTTVSVQTLWSTSKDPADVLRDE